jgi:hypothetical protein
MDTKRYEEVCEDLGIRPEVHFVRLLPGGAIGYSAGKPEEVRDLARRADAKGYRLSADLRAAVRMGR